MNKKIESEQFLFDILKEIADSSSSEVKVINIIGGAGSGKTTLANSFVEYLQNACRLSTDDYVIGDREYRRKYLEGSDPLKKYKPEALNEIISTIKNLKPNEVCPVPTYNDKTGEAVDAKIYEKVVKPVKYIIIEGDFNFVQNPDLTIYLDVDDNTRLQNRIERDKRLRGEVDENAIIENFNLRQKLQHIPYTAPVKSIADIVISASKENPETKYCYEISFQNSTFSQEKE